MRVPLLLSPLASLLSPVTVSALVPSSPSWTPRPRAASSPFPRDDARRGRRGGRRGDGAVALPAVAAVAPGRRDATRPSRRDALRAAAAPWVAACWGDGTAIPRASARAVERTTSRSGRSVERAMPDEGRTYAEAQGGIGRRVLWVGAGAMDGAYRNLFFEGGDVVALDLVAPDASDSDAAVTYAAEHGYRLSFERGDATDMKSFPDGTFDAVVSSMFLCQDFDPEVVVSEVRRVLKPGGRFGFYEHVEDIDRVIVDKVFGERSVIWVQAWPEKTNVIAGVVTKV